MNPWKRIGLLLMVCLLLCSALVAGAQEKKAKEKREGNRPKAEAGFGLASSRSPIEITSDTVEANQKQNTVTFAGNVVAKQEDMTIQSSTLVVHYDAESKKIREIQVIGNVKVVQKDRRASCQKAIFHQNENRVVMEGDVVVREGENVIRGERVVYFLDEERSIVEGGKGGRVTTTITPPKKEPQ